jgi:hypothetical protein
MEINIPDSINVDYERKYEDNFTPKDFVDVYLKFGGAHIKQWKDVAVPSYYDDDQLQQEVHEFVAGKLSKLLDALD